MGSVRADWHTPARRAPDDSDPFDGQEAAEAPGPVDTRGAGVVPGWPNGRPPRLGNGTATPTLHPTPVSYWNEDAYTLETPPAELEARLAELVKREANLFDAEVVCDLKDQPEMTCSACPVNEVGRDSRLSALCRLGREQERIIALLITKRHRDVPAE